MVLILKTKHVTPSCALSYATNFFFSVSTRVTIASVMAGEARSLWDTVLFPEGITYTSILKMQTGHYRGMPDFAYVAFFAVVLVVLRQLFYTYAPAHPRLECMHASTHACMPVGSLQCRSVSGWA